MPGTNPLRTSLSTMVYNGTVILLLDAGNYPGQSNFLNLSYTWSGNSTTGNWTNASTDSSGGIDPLGPLPLRLREGMALDGSSTEIVLFGGEGQSSEAGVLFDTWTWNTNVNPAGAWTLQTPGTSPPGRFRHQMAVLHGVGALMFGGCNVLYPFEDTWLWSGGNGGNWTQLTPGVTPPARMDFAMAGSTDAANVLMFGGVQNGDSLLDDTWMWVGSASGDWVKQTPAVSPPAMSLSVMCYDHSNSSYVLFGGAGTEGLIGPQTWVWTGGNGGNWALCQPAVTPPARVGAQMAFDGTNVIMFGGYGTASNVFDETWMWVGGGSPATTGNWVQL